MNTDILTILELAATEIRELRTSLESYRSLWKCLAAHLAISQMRGVAISYRDADPAVWDAIVKLQANDRIALTSSGEVLLDLKELTTELLHAEMSKSTKAP